MDASAFWKVIGEYNGATIIPQLGLTALLAASAIFSSLKHRPAILKIYLSIANLFIAIVFFGMFGTEPIQKYFAFPLYMAVGLLFMYEAIANRKDAMGKLNITQIALLVLFSIYPAVSYLLGHRFPELVTHIMPCPIVALSLAIYSAFHKKNMVLYALLIVWGLTGVKSIVFSAYEDLILLAAGVYGLFDFVSMLRKKKSRGLYLVDD